MKHLAFSICLLIFITLPLTATAQVVTIPDPVPPPRSVRDMFELDPFYQQWIDVDGLPVVASAQVNPYALKESAWQIWQMIGHRSDVLQSFVQERLRFSIIAHNELISEIPEYSFPFPDFLSFWQRGIGGVGLEVPGHPAVSSAEENILHYPGHRGGGLYNTLIHEFAHAIHLFGLNPIDPTFETRLKVAYDAAIAKGLWQGTYASSDIREYWAEGTHGWFYPKGGGSFTNYGNTRSALKAYDPGLAALLTEIYGDTQWRYTPPADRLNLPHLQGFNPQDSPTYQGFPELEELYYRQFHDPNSDGGDNWVDLRPYDPSLIPILNESRPPGRLTGISFLNVTQADVLLYFVRRDGTEGYWTRARPGIARGTPTRTDVLWLIKDPNGRNLAVFQPVEQAGRAIIRKEMGLITPGLSKVSGDNQAGISGAVLAKPFVVEVRAENLSVLEGISVTFTVVAGDGTLSATHATTDANGQAESRFTLGASLGTHTVSVAAAGVGQSVVFNAVAEAAVAIPDPNLRAVVLTALNKPKNDLIIPSELATLTRLAKRNANISNLTGLESATNLTTLDLDENNITDISPVVGLTNLTWLLLGGNNISDISGLAGLTNLTELSLYNNNISDISAVTELSNLRSLWLSGNNVSDISAVAGLTNLTFLGLGENNIIDISPLAGLTNLTSLALGGNNITDISPLVGLTNLTRLRLWENNIIDISPLAGLTNLTSLALGGNNITDISPLVGLTNLTWLQLWKNNITDIVSLVNNVGLGTGDEVELNNNPLSELSIQNHIPALQDRGVTVEFDRAATGERVNIPDPNLRAAIERILGEPITTAKMAGLRTLVDLGDSESNISDLTGLEHATNLFVLALLGNNITDLSPLAGLTNLFVLGLPDNNITDISPLAGLTNLTTLYLQHNNITDISPLVGLTNLTTLWIFNNNITDLSPLVTNRGLGDEDEVYVDETVHALNINTHIPTLQSRGVTVLQTVDIPDANLRAAIGEVLGKASLDPITTADMETLTEISAPNANISDLTGLEHATNLTTLDLDENNITDISPLVANTGLGDGDVVSVDGTPLSYTSINTHIPTLRSRGVEVRANNLKPPTLEYTLSISVGLNLIHVPLKVTAVDGVAKTIESISDLYDALGGADAVNFLITYDTSTQGWLTYFGVVDRGTASDKALTDQMGIIAGIKTDTSVRLTGKPLGTNGSSTISLNQGRNIVGLPLRDSRINRVSDLLSLEGIRGNVPGGVLVTVNGDFKLVGRAGDPNDIPITGGQGFILTVQRATTVTLSGEGWTNVSATAASPQILTGIKGTDTTPVLALGGEIVDEVSGVNRSDFRVAVKNLSTGRRVAATPSDDGAGYRLTVVDIETMRAARVSDVLEITVQSTSPFIGVKPLRYTVTALDVKRGLIRLPALVAYEIPKETELLANYPNPFNPETWIPYRLAEDAFVTLTIYDREGHAVRAIDVGHRVAAVYESRSKAIYWDGRNAVGEQVASGVYFYHLSTGDYSATRKMIILK